jgi:trans-aconitate 2-methyltransferase
VTSGTTPADPADAWRPLQYHRFRDERSRPFHDLLGLVERDGWPRRGPRIVDLGCGTGELTAHAHRFLDASETVGLDASPAMLADAAAHAGPRVRFARADIAAFPDRAPEATGDERFDVVLANASLQWVPDHERVLASWSTALTDDGQLAVQVPSNVDHPAHVVADEVAHEDRFAAAFADAPGGVPPTDPVRNVLPPEGYAALLDALGFGRQHVRLQVYGHHHETTADVVEWVKGTNLTRFQAVLAPDAFAEYVDRYRTRLVEVLGDQRPYFYPFKRILLWARR